MPAWLPRLFAKIPRPNLKHLARMRPPSRAEMVRRTRAWIKKNWRFWGASTLGHAVLFCFFALILGTIAGKPRQDMMLESFTDVTMMPEAPIARLDMSNVPLEVSELTTQSLTDIDPISQEEEFNDDSKEFEQAGGGTAVQSALSMGGLGGFDVIGRGDGPTADGGSGVGEGVGTSDKAGQGGAKSGFGHRGAGRREGIDGSTPASERAVAAGLLWLSRHQNANGSWSLKDFHYRCNKCDGASDFDSDMAATAMALLPFLAAGQTQDSPGPYRKVIQAGLGWMTKHQSKDGGLCEKDFPQFMYVHGLAAITLCEAFGMTGDQRIGRAAQSAIRFIERAQNPSTGGWRYKPGSIGDTSVLGWQVMALKSGQMAGLQVNYSAFAGAEKWLDSCALGEHGGRYSYTPGVYDKQSMTAVGLLCRQYMGHRRDAPDMVEGTSHLMEHLPTNAERDVYYWYYATQVMHNMPGPEWDEWNRKMRKILIESQVKEGCAAGSWDPALPTPDAWASGGRVMMTSLATLTLEVYYRYLPLYKLDERERRNMSPPAESAEVTARRE